jgi:hypothetical protein
VPWYLLDTTRMNSPSVPRGVSLITLSSSGYWPSAVHESSWDPPRLVFHSASVSFASPLSLSMMTKGWFGNYSVLMRSLPLRQSSVTPFQSIISLLRIFPSSAQCVELFTCLHSPLSADQLK